MVDHFVFFVKTSGAKSARIFFSSGMNVMHVIKEISLKAKFETTDIACKWKFLRFVVRFFVVSKGGERRESFSTESARICLSLLDMTVSMLVPDV